MAKHLRVPYADEGPVAAGDLQDADCHDPETCARCDDDAR